MMIHPFILSCIALISLNSPSYADDARSEGLIVSLSLETDQLQPGRTRISADHRHCKQPHTKVLSLYAPVHNGFTFRAQSIVDGRGSTRCGHHCDTPPR